MSPFPAMASGSGAAAALASLGERLPTGTGSTPHVARELETIFLTQLLQVMRKTVPQSDFLPKSAERDVYDGMFDRTVAEAMASQDPLGFERALKVPGNPPDTDVGKNPSWSQGGHR